MVISYLFIYFLYGQVLVHTDREGEADFLFVVDSL